MTTVVEGQKYWKTGDHSHVWVVDAVLHKPEDREPYVILVSEDGTAAEDVDLSHLDNPELYRPVPAGEEGQHAAQPGS